MAKIFFLFKLGVLVVFFNDCDKVSFNENIYCHPAALQFICADKEQRSIKKKKKNNSHITKLIFSFQKMRNLQLMEMFLLGFFALVINADTWEKGGR